MNDSFCLIEQAANLACSGKYGAARTIYHNLLQTEVDDSIRERIENDLSLIAAAQGHTFSALLHRSRLGNSFSDSQLAVRHHSLMMDTIDETDETVKIAILSLLFNWPSTGGGTVHTKELADFLMQDGYQVQHIYAVNESFGVGTVTQELGYKATPLHFAESEWDAATIRQRFQLATNEFSPDWVIITDSWNTKPLLAEAVRDYPYFLRIAAQESICPLNNVRMLFESKRANNDFPPIVQCEHNQLASPQICRECVTQNAHLSGGLHQAERFLADFDAEEYPHRLQQCFAQAEGVLVVNPSIAELVKPYSPCVHVVPSGFDVLRFPQDYQSPAIRNGEKIRILFAGLREELMKGFHVLQAATEQLSQHRNDFELWITGEAHKNDPEYFRCIGWQTQQQLSEAMIACDLLVFPTVAQEALGRSAVEAMACGRAVIASRLGGLEWVVDHETTGLLFEPGNIDDLCLQLERLLDDQELREKLGKAGYQKFHREFTWEVILKNSYHPLFGPADKQELLQELKASS